MITAPRKALMLTTVAAAALGLAGCSGQEETTYEADVTDESGDGFVVSDENPDAVEVELPETEMTPVAPEAEGAAADEAEAPAEAE